MNFVVLGLGYSAQTFLQQAGSRFGSVTATVRTPAKSATLSCANLNVLPYAGGEAPPALARAIAEADALLVSIPAEEGGDPALPALAPVIAAAPRLRWIGYLSTVGVYGDHGGAVVTEASPLLATSPRGRNRIAAEGAWLDLGVGSGKPVHVFRLAGIYGPGRNQLVSVAEGSARRIIKAGQKFSRIHVEDIAGVCLASLERPRAGAIYNVADNEPAPPQDVIALAASLLGLPPPPEEPFETAALSQIARSFYMDSRQISNGLVRAELGYSFRYPTYREGLKALLAAGEGQAA